MGGAHCGEADGQESRHRHSDANGEGRLPSGVMLIQGRSVASGARVAFAHVSATFRTAIVARSGEVVPNDRIGQAASGGLLIGCELSGAGRCRRGIATLLATYSASHWRDVIPAPLAVGLRRGAGCRCRSRRNPRLLSPTLGEECGQVSPFVVPAAFAAFH